MTYRLFLSQFYLLFECLKQIRRSLFSSLRLINTLSKTQQIKLQVGSSGKRFEGWTNTEIHQLDITNSRNWSVYFKNKPVSNILAEHVWEHLTLEQARTANKLCFQFLSQGGCLRIAIPDGFNPDSDYISYVQPGGYGDGSDDHKILYNYILLKKELEAVGFNVKLLEYWDEKGVFHYSDWTDENGHISRSRRYDPRNKNGKLNYTSLIVDAIKPVTT